MRRDRGCARVRKRKGERKDDGGNENCHGLHGGKVTSEM